MKINDPLKGTNGRPNDLTTSRMTHLGRILSLVISMIGSVALIATSVFASSINATSLGDLAYFGAAAYFNLPTPGALDSSRSETAALNSMAVFMAGAKMNKLFVDDVLATEGYQIEAGDPIWAQATNLTSSRGYKFEVKDFGGSSAYMSGCKTGSTTLSDKFPGGALDEFASGAAGYKFILHEFNTSTCGGGEITGDADNTLTFYVAQIFFYRDPALSMTADPPTFNANETVYAQIKGLAPGQNTWSNTWIKPVGTTACANTGGGDRPGSDASGVLPNGAGTFLQYPPTTGAAWNTLTNYEARPCEALSPNNGGTWELKLAKSSTLTVTLQAFQAVVLTANDDSYGPNPPNQDFSVGAPGVLSNDINPGGQGSMVANKVTDPSHGTVMLNSDGSFTYHPDHDWVGTDTFTYDVMNGNQTSNTGTVTIVTGAATPTFTFQACTSGFTTAPIYPYGLAPSFTSVVFNESEVLRAFAASSDGKVIAWYNDEHALTLGVRQINIRNSATQTLSYPADGLLGRPSFTAMTVNPGSTTNPAVGWTFLKDGATSPTGLAGTDTATWNSTYGFADHSRPLWPALFVTDITDDASSTAGDWQIAPIPTTNMPTEMYAVPPHQVMGTWKGALRTVDKSVTPNTHVTTPDVDPSKNNWNGVPDIPPGGFARYTNEGYGAEVIWNMSLLNLIPGHRYRFQFMVHDGDQNKVGGDSGEGCMQAFVNQSQLPGLMVTKTNDVNSGNLNGRITSIGQVVTYSYLVKNTGSVTLTNLVARDTNIGTAYNAAGTVFSCPKTILLPLEQMTCSATRTIQPGDATGSPVAGSNNLVNIVTITGTKPDNNPITATDTNTIPVQVNGSLKITKTVINPDNATIPGPFTIHYDCGGSYVGDVFIPAAGGYQIINDLLAGSSCTVTEPAPAPIQNYTWGTPVITGSPATIGSNTTVEVTVANSITRDRGTFTMAKTTSNPDGATLPATFTMNYDCGLDTNGSPLTGQRSFASGGNATVGGIPTGNTCSVSEVAPAIITGFTWGMPTYTPASIVIGSTNGTFTVTVANSITRDRGTFTIAKTTSNPDGATLPATFTMNYDCGLDTNGSALTGQRSFASGASVSIGGIPTGNTCTVTEVAPASIPGFTWGTPTYTPSSIAIGSSNGTFTVTVANSITRDRGTFTIAKTTANPDGATLPSLFTMNYDCGLDANGSPLTGQRSVVSGGSAIVGGIPTGNTCSVTEVAPDTITGFTWGIPAYTPASIVIGSTNGTFTVTVQNSITRDRGTFTIAKTTSNPDGATLPAAFTMNYNCGLDTNGSPLTGQTSFASGGSAVVNGIPTGNTCTVTEVAPASIPGFTWAAPTYTPASIVIGSASGTFTVTVGNSITRDRGTLIVIKHVVNGEGFIGGKVAGDFTITVTNSANPPSFGGAEDPGTPVIINAGSYSVAEVVQTGYKDTYSADCIGVMPTGGSKTCTITNTRESLDIQKSSVLSLGPDNQAGVGDIVTYTFTVTNTGETTLQNIAVKDNLPGLSAINCGPPDNNNIIPSLGHIAPNNTTTCTATYHLTPQDLIHHHVLNTVIACAEGGVCTTPACDPGEVCTPPTCPPGEICDTDDNDLPIPSLLLDKSASPTNYDHVNQEITYSYLVTNNGTADLAGPITVTDDKVTVGCPPVNTVGNLDGVFNPGESLTCTAHYLITQADIDRGSVINIARAHASYDGNSIDSNQDTVTVTSGTNPSLSIVKKTNGTDNNSAPGPYVAVGSTVTWTYEVTNTGNVTLTSIGVVDDRGVLVSCPVTTLAPGASTICTASGPATAGQYTNTGTASGMPPTGPAVTASDVDHYFGSGPSVSIVKLTNGTNNDSPTGPHVPVGSTVTWTYSVANTGNVPLTNVAVTDDNGTPGNTADDFPAAPVLSGGFNVGDSDHNGLLDLGETWRYTASGTAVAGQYTNTGTVTADDANNTGQHVTASNPDNYFGDNAQLAIRKYANDVDSDCVHVAVGSTVTFRYVVTNPGNVPIANVVVTDNVLGTITGPDSGDTHNPGQLDTDETWVYTKTATAITGEHHNTGTVNGVDSFITASTVTNSDGACYTGNNPSVSIVKLTNGTDNDNTTGPHVPVGSTVTWTYNVTNTGNSALNGIVVTDDHGVTVTCPGTTLAAGASMTCTATGTATAGQYTNIGTVHAADADTGAPVMASNPDHYFGDAPAIRIVKFANNVDNDCVHVGLGSTVTFTYVVTNPGNVPIANVVVTDDVLGTITGPASGDTHNLGQLDTDETWVYTKTATALTGEHHNTGTVTGFDAFAAKSMVTSSDEACYIGQVTGDTYPTATTCSQFLNGSATALNQIDYKLQGGRIGIVTPGVFFYYQLVMVPNTGPLTVAQSMDAFGTRLFTTQQPVLWNANCGKVSGVSWTIFGDNGSQVTSSTVPPGTYIVAVKYDAKSIEGALAPPSANHEAEYYFMTKQGSVPLGEAETPYMRLVPRP